MTEADLKKSFLRKNVWSEELFHIYDNRHGNNRIEHKIRKEEMCLVYGGRFYCLGP